MISLPGKVSKLGEIKIDKVKDSVEDLLLDGEEVIAAFESSWTPETVAFTTKRMIVCTVRGAKTDFTSLPYRAIEAFSVEAAGGFDSDAEMILSFGGREVKLGFKGHADVALLARTIGGFVL